MEIIPSGSVSYQTVEAAFALVGHGVLYGSLNEVGWRFDHGTWPPVDPSVIPEDCSGGVLVNPDFSINTYGLRTLSCERVRAPGVTQVPFRLAHKTNLGLRRLDIPQASGSARVYGSVAEVGWLYSA